MLLSLLSGVLFAVAWPERGISLLIFLAFVPLLFVQQYLGDTNKKGMFWYAWLAFVTWNALTTWWIWYSTDVGSILAIALNSLFVAVVFLLFHLSKKKLFDNKKGFFILLFYWITWEFFHMNWDLTWSWLNLGNVFAVNHRWIQWYEYTGTLGGTAWVIAGNILLFHALKGFFQTGPKRTAIIHLTGFVLLVGVPVAFSYYIYYSYQETVNPVEVVVVQPNTDPYNEQYTRPPLELLQSNLEMAATMITDSTDFVVYPESTLYDGARGFFEHQLDKSPSIQMLNDFVLEYPHVSIIIGASSQRILDKDEPKTSAARKFYNSDSYYYSYNSAFLIDESGQIQIHHKSKLTPGVEILPSWGILKPIEKLALNLGGTTGSLGTEDHPVVFNTQSNEIVSPIICYESIYGEFVAKTVRKGAGLIFVITNDGWWGNTPGHRQHFMYSKLRAIETRRSIARSANTGISAFIDQKGDILVQTEYWVPDVIRRTINSNDTLTYYVKNGDYIARTSVFISVLILLMAFTRGILRKKKNLE